jgi:hypothetical protein
VAARAQGSVCPLGWKCYDNDGDHGGGGGRQWWCWWEWCSDGWCGFVDGVAGIFDGARNGVMSDVGLVANGE